MGRRLLVMKAEENSAKCKTSPIHMIHVYSTSFNVYTHYVCPTHCMNSSRFQKKR